MSTDEQSTSPVAGVFINRTQVEQAIQALKRAGFNDADIETHEEDTGEGEPKRFVVMVQAVGRQHEANEILHRHGAFDKNTAFAQSQSTGYNATVNPLVHDSDSAANQLIEDGSQDSSFERPIAPGDVEPGGWLDPNDRTPRIP